MVDNRLLTLFPWVIVLFFSCFSSICHASDAEDDEVVVFRNGGKIYRNDLLKVEKNYLSCKKTPQECEEQGWEELRLGMAFCRFNQTIKKFKAIGLEKNK